MSVFGAMLDTLGLGPSSVAIIEESFADCVNKKDPTRGLAKLESHLDDLVIGAYPTNTPAGQVNQLHARLRLFQDKSLSSFFVYSDATRGCNLTISSLLSFIDLQQSIFTNNDKIKVAHGQAVELLEAASRANPAIKDGKIAAALQEIAPVAQKMMSETMALADGAERTIKTQWLGNLLGKLQVYESVAAKLPLAILGVAAAGWLMGAFGKSKETA